MSLKILRKKIEKIDRCIIQLLSERFKTTKQIQNLKIDLCIPLLQKKREKTLFKKYQAYANAKKLNKTLIKKLFNLIFRYSRKTDIIKRWKKNKKSR
ncbi:chorismate mutase [Candidatus Peregrinibacteria bacterium]|nr:chorismate mutase [Candidatus Peregrinibacteria bacterium]